jgi:hypothetical protein
MKVLNEEGEKELLTILNSINASSFFHVKTILVPNAIYKSIGIDGSPFRKVLIEIAIPDRFWEEREDVQGAGILSYEFLEDIDFKEFVEDIPAKKRKSKKEAEK